MSIFSNILEKLGIRHEAAATTQTTTSSGPSALPSAGAAPSAAGAAAAAPGAAPPKAVPVVDVVAQLDQRAKSHAEKLNWRTSIVDLLKLLDLDSSLEARKSLAKELGCPQDLIGGDYSKMNMWLHKTVLEKIAANGGNVPADLHKAA